MTKRLRSIMIGVLLVWMAGLGGMAVLVARDVDTSSSLFVSLFQQQATPVAEMALIAEPQPEPPVAVVAEAPPPPEPALPLLPHGRQGGQGTLFKGQLTRDGSTLVLTVPYKGQVREYTAYSIPDKKARIINIHGKMRCNFYVLRFDASWPVRLIQMAAHDGFSRISVLGTEAVHGFTEEIRYTPNELIIRLTPQKPKV